MQHGGSLTQDTEIAVSTFQTRLSALAAWHLLHSFPFIGLTNKDEEDP